MFTAAVTSSPPPPPPLIHFTETLLIHFDMADGGTYSYYVTLFLSGGGSISQHAFVSVAGNSFYEL